MDYEPINNAFHCYYARSILLNGETSWLTPYVAKLIESFKAKSE